MTVSHLRLNGNHMWRTCSPLSPPTDADPDPGASWARGPARGSLVVGRPAALMSITSGSSRVWTRWLITRTRRRITSMNAPGDVGGLLRTQRALCAGETRVIVRHDARARRGKGGGGGAWTMCGCFDKLSWASTLPVSFPSLVTRVTWNYNNRSLHWKNMKIKL